MKGAIASVELFAWSPPMPPPDRPTAKAEHDDAPRPRRLTLVVGTPVRSPGSPSSPGGPDSVGWTCRVALADLKRPVEVVAADSVGALSAALAQGEAWLAELRGDGIVFTRDRAGDEPYRVVAPDLQEQAEE